MGKSKRKRAQSHVQAVKVAGAEGPSAPECHATSASAVHQPMDLENVFSKTDIDMNAMKRTMSVKDFDDSKSRLTSKSFKGSKITKKEKRQLKKEFFINKIDQIRQTEKASKQKKKREQTPVVGDMNLLADALPTMDMFMRDLDTPQGPQGGASSMGGGQKVRGVPTEKQRRRQQEKNVQQLEAVKQQLGNFENKGATIMEHLRNKQLQEDRMDMK